MNPKANLTFFMLVCALAGPVQASYNDLIGYPELQALLGSAIPDGSGIAVQQIEGTQSGNYMPSGIPPGATEFTTPDKSFTNESAGVDQGSTGTSSHAASVGVNFYGNVSSIAPGIIDVSAWEAAHWLGFDDTSSGLVATSSSFLRALSSDAPMTTAARVANHSYIGDLSSDSDNLDVVRRIDYVVDEDDFLQVVGIQNGSSTDEPLLKSAFNVISVGRTNGSHREGTLAIDAAGAESTGVYTAGRTAPHVVAPGFNPSDTSTLTSFATPMVSAAVGLLLDSGQDAGLSTGTITNRTRTINHAETSEVIKATIMAGADRMIDNARGDDLTDYSIDTSNNLDLDYGAGQVNVFHNHLIQAAGEHDGDTTDIGNLGWDYGTVSGTDDTASYFFTAALPGTLYASLAWNIDISDSDGGAGFAPEEQLYNLDLLLVDVSAGNVMLTAPGTSSMSTMENTENVFFEGLVAGNRYELRVVQAGGQDPFDWDYGLAWRVATVPEPASGLLLLAGLAAAASLLGRTDRRG